MHGNLWNGKAAASFARVASIGVTMLVMGATVCAADSIGV